VATINTGDSRLDPTAAREPARITPLDDQECRTLTGPSNPTKAAAFVGIYDPTGINWGSLTQAVIGPAITITVIAAVAAGSRWLAHRMITKTATALAQGRMPALLSASRHRPAPRSGSALSPRRAQRAQTIGSVLRSTASLVIYGIASMQVLSELGIDVTPIIASAGVLGVAVGFGAQNLVKDFLSGMFMMLEDQYGVGDLIDLGSAVGTVEAVGLRVTTVRDTAGTAWYIRNGTITAVGNSSQHHAVAVIDIPVAREANTARALAVAEQAARHTLGEDAVAEDALGDLEVLGVHNVTGDTLTLRLTVTTRPGRGAIARRALTAAILNALTAADIPAPRTELIHPAPSTASTAAQPGR